MNSIMKSSLAGPAVGNLAVALCIVLLLFVHVNSEPLIKITRNYSLPVAKEFKVYWNVPTFVCRKYGYDFKKYHEKYNIISNDKDNFRGKKINILYDPGAFPAVLKSRNGRFTDRNGGIPQLGNITVHLEAFRKVVEEVVSPQLTGLGIIDFETWRPNFRQNWKEQVIYRNMSTNLERQHNPQWPEKKIMENARLHFERAAEVFMKKTLELAKMLRPKASWGYYGFPYCYNYRSKNSPSCPDVVLKENDHIHWLFETSTALYPSIYMSSKLGDVEQVQFVVGRLNEAWRMATRVRKKNFPQVYPYVWYKYHDKNEFLTKADIYTSIEVPRLYKMGGIIIWGASDDVNTKEKCHKVFTYLNNVLGPALEKSRNNENNVDQSTSSIWSTLVPLPSFFRPKALEEENDELKQLNVTQTGEKNEEQLQQQQQQEQQQQSLDEESDFVYERDVSDAPIVQGEIPQNEGMIFPKESETPAVDIKKENVAEVSEFFEGTEKPPSSHLWEANVQQDPIEEAQPDAPNYSQSYEFEFSHVQPQVPNIPSQGHWVFPGGSGPSSHLKWLSVLPDYYQEGGIDPSHRFNPSTTSEHQSGYYQPHWLSPSKPESEQQFIG